MAGFGMKIRSLRKNKKGMLLATEVVKIVIAVICISFLVYLLFSIYYNNKAAQDKQEAQSTINRIKDIITRIENKAINNETIPDISPASWYFFSYVGSETKPNFCAGEDCLCICEKISAWNSFWGGKQVSTCDQKGVCIPVKNLKSFGSFEIKSISNGGTNVEIKNNSNFIEVLQK